MTLRSFGQATNDAMAVIMRSDPTVIMLGENITWGGTFGQYQGLRDEFGSRVIDTPISESNMVSTAIGAAMTGLRPVVSVGFIEFVLGAMDELVSQASKIRYMFGGQVSVPIVVRGSDGTIRSAGAQHSESLEGLFAHIPGLKVVMPSNPVDAKGLLVAAVADDDPVIFLENKRIQGYKADVPDGLYEQPLGQAAIVVEGEDVTIVAYSVMVHHAIAACEILAASGIRAELIDLRTLVPLDFDTIRRSVQKTRRAVICHEAWQRFGPGAEIAARLYEELFGLLAAPICRIGARDAHIPFAPILERAVVPGVEEIVAAARAVTSN